MTKIDPPNRPPPDRRPGWWLLRELGTRTAADLLAEWLRDFIERFDLL